MRRHLVLMHAVLAVLAAGCSGRQAFLGPDFGRSVDGALAAQAPRREPPARAVLGLDPQEAAIVSATYQAGLAPKGTRVKDEPIILVGPNTRDHMQAPAPSVPRE